MGVVEVGEKPKAGQTIHGHRDRATVCSVKHRNSHSVLVRPRQSLSHAALLVHPNGTIWTVMDLQGQKNATCEIRPGYP